MKKQMSVELAEKMRLWREGHIAMPKEYIEFHMDMAAEALQELENEGVQVHNKWIASDGWGDGMKSLYAVIENGSELVKIKWSDGSQGWMKEVGGWVPWSLGVSPKERVYQVVGVPGIEGLLSLEELQARFEVSEEKKSPEYIEWEKKIGRSWLLRHAPKVKGLVGPMGNGPRCVRYESQEVYNSYD